MEENELTGMLEHIETITARMRYQEAQGGGRSIDSDEFTIIISDYVNQDSFVNDVDSSEILIDFEKIKLAEIFVKNAFNALTML